MKKFLIAIPVLLAGVLYWALAQTAPAALATLFPPGALVYLEARDFSTLLAGWDSSAEKRAWLQSANYQEFSRSRLFLRLHDAQSEFAAAAGVPPDYALVSSIAGGNSALAIYNIGELQFLYITHLASARAMATALWNARGHYQTRHAGGVDYYVKEDAASHRVAAFAYAGDLLIVATKEDLIAGALQLLEHPGASLVSEGWFSNANQAAPAGANDLRLVYDLNRLRATPHFRSYWIQRNASALAEFSSGLADLEFARGEIRERRVLLRANPATAPDESATGPLLAAAPEDAGFYRAWLNPSAEQARRLIEEKIFSATPAPAIPNNGAPAVVTTADAGTEQDLETRIDEAPIRDDRVAAAFQALQERLAPVKLTGMLQVEKTHAGDVFAGTDSAIVLLASADWDANAIRAAFAQAAGSLWSVDGMGALDGLAKINVAVAGRWLIAGNSPDLVKEILARRNRPAVPGADYAAEWRHARELPDFERITRLIDFPQIPPADPNGAREPMFYSENLAGLGRVLGRVESAGIAVHDAGAMLRESVIYRMAP
ncbi:MAG TPA: hypothetical protein VMB85_12830 [Bryobacteraceae bacterium]|nr:hypothetical protein [Bryobacteraceae bacterium]